MSDSNPPMVVQSSGPKVPVVLVLVIALIAATGYLFYQLHQTRTEMAQMRDQLLDEISKIHETTAVTTQTSRRSVETLKAELDAARRQANQLAGQAKLDAEKHADEIASNLQKVQQDQAQKVSAVTTEVGKVKEQATAATTRIGEVSTDVGNVKTDLASTKTDLNQTKMSLQKVAGDLGVTSGYVATNGKELEELKRRGERNYIEFTLRKQKQMQRVGDISMKLDKADPKHNKFTLNVLADDKNTQKKDRNINEPLQFYVAKSLYEIVVNSVGKDQIAGYLSTPKYQARNQ